MKLINRDTDYAVRALVHMAKSPQQISSAKVLVDDLHMPRAFSRRLLQVLSKKGILQSAKGKGGGFSFRKSPKKIKLKDLVEVFQKDFIKTRCIFKKKICPDIGTCPLRHKIRGIEKKVIDELAAISIADLIKD
ncbi:MAG: Rrf2 family transcriptional regulator [bacterium]|nr:Rrf2 family transcriptional regulator [bacterium]MDD5756787.1 Rrf2 family transcriptional regulator [bacterium]